jgi:hypothetical protein
MLFDIIITETKLPEVKITKEKKPDKLKNESATMYATYPPVGGQATVETGFKNYLPNNDNKTNIWQVIKGQTLSPLTCAGMIKKTSKQTIDITTLQTYKTLLTLPDGFGVVQNVITGDQQLIHHFAGADGSSVLSDLIIGAYVIISGGITEISVTGGQPDQKTFLPIALVVF